MIDVFLATSIATSIATKIGHESIMSFSFGTKNGRVANNILMPDFNRKNELFRQKKSVETAQKEGARHEKLHPQLPPSELPRYYQATTKILLRLLSQ